MSLTDRICVMVSTFGVAFAFRFNDRFAAALTVCMFVQFLAEAIANKVLDEGRKR